jgi:transposase
MNLALVFGEDSRLPFYYRKLAGNIPDVKTVRSLLADFEALGFNKVKLVMDRGFYSADNINGLLKEHLKFLISIRTSLLFVRNELDKVYEDLPSFENYDETHQLYSMTVPSEWDYVQERPYKGTPLKEKRHVYLHLYYNIDRAAEDQKNFDLKLMMLNKELVSGNRKSEHEKLYDKYFVITETPPCGSKIQVNRDEVKKAKKYYGYFALMSNEKMDSISALSLYRNKDLVEKAFGNLKERLCLRRSLVSSEQSLSGKLFVEFVALIYLSFINRRMQDTGLYKEYTMSSLLDKIDVIECFLRPNRKLTVGEVIEKQISIFNHFNILPPVSL